MHPRFNWKHLPAVLGALAFVVIFARDQLFIAPFVIVVPALMGLAVGALGRTLGAGVATFFFLVFAGTLCWLEPLYFDALPTVLLAELLGAVLGRGLVVRSRRMSEFAPDAAAQPRRAAAHR